MTTKTAVTINTGLSYMQTEMGYVRLADGSDYQNVFQLLAPKDSLGANSEAFNVTAPNPGFGVFIRVYNQITTGALPQLFYPNWYGNLLTYYNAATAEPQTQIIELGFPRPPNTTWQITVNMTYYMVGSVLKIEFGAFTPLYFGQIQFDTNPTQLDQRVQLGTYSKPGFKGLTVLYDSGSKNPLEGSSPVIPTTYYPIPGSGIGWYIKLFANWQQKYYWIGDLQDFISGGSLVNQATGYPAVQSFYATMNGSNGVQPEELIINYYITVDQDNTGYNTLIIGIAGYQVGAARRKPRSFHRSTSAYDNTTTTTSTCHCSCIEHSIKPKY
jgi:hypothetical protein